MWHSDCSPRLDMISRHTLSLSLVSLSLVALVGCGQSHSPIVSVDAGTTTMSDGAIALSPDTGTDSGFSTEAGVVCDSELGPAACLAAGCAPDFDDACCPMCNPGACADCQNFEYHSCQSYASACLGGPSCGVAPAWGCGPAAPFCDGAHAVDLDSCDRVGCVPGFPSGTGDPVLSTATCIPIQMDSCTVACRSLPPPCPTGTTAEGDGFCYTGVCIPSFVCR